MSYTLPISVIDAVLLLNQMITENHAQKIVSLDTTEKVTAEPQKEVKSKREKPDAIEKIQIIIKAHARYFLSKMAASQKNCAIYIQIKFYDAFI